jgi:hypothetical protein
MLLVAGAGSESQFRGNPLKSSDVETHTVENVKEE